jgi:hypothetical protein
MLGKRVAERVCGLELKPPNPPSSGDRVDTLSFVARLRRSSHDEFHNAVFKLMHNRTAIELPTVTLRRSLNNLLCCVVYPFFGYLIGAVFVLLVDDGVVLGARSVLARVRLQHCCCLFGSGLLLVCLVFAASFATCIVGSLALLLENVP